MEDLIYRMVRPVGALEWDWFVAVLESCVAADDVALESGREHPTVELIMTIEVLLDKRENREVVEMEETDSEVDENVEEGFELVRDADGQSRVL